MQIPFTTKEFMENLRMYNEGVFPSQLIIYLMGFISIYLSIKPARHSDKIISGVLAFFWIWMGTVYHLYFFSAINKAAYLFGGLFIFQGILFLILGVFKDALSFKFRSGINGFAGLVLMLFALILYPVLGYSFNHVYPFSPTLGLPCPTTIFTFGLLLLGEKRCPITILIVPFLWSVVGFTAAFKFGIVEDVSLLIAGVTTFIFVVARNRASTKRSV